MNAKIRRMEKSDISEIVKIEALSYGEHHWSKESFHNELSNDLARYYCFVNEEDKVLGYIGCWHIFEEAHITTLSVHPDYRNQKIAQKLICKMLDDCYKNKIKYITLEVRESNIPAIALYEKNGFKSIGTRKGYYQDNNEDALIMFTENIWHERFKSIYNRNKGESDLL
jgi:ribosomal-protein-alanine N-acetyltransferase